MYFRTNTKDSSSLPPLSSPWGTYSDYPRCCRLTASAYQLPGWKTLRNCAKLQTRFATGCRHCVGSRNDNGSGNPPELRRTRPHVAVHCPTVARSGRSADCLPPPSPLPPSAWQTGNTTFAAATNHFQVPKEKQAKTNMKISSSNSSGNTEQH